MKNDNSMLICKESLSQLKSAIEEGIKSGKAENFDPKKHLASLKAARKTFEIPPSSE